VPKRLQQTNNMRCSKSHKKQIIFQPSSLLLFVKFEFTCMSNWRYQSCKFPIHAFLQPITFFPNQMHTICQIHIFIANYFQNLYLLVTPTSERPSRYLLKNCVLSTMSLKKMYNTPLFPSSWVQTRPKPLDFYWRKNPQYAFLRRGSKRICPMSQLCGM